MGCECDSGYYGPDCSQRTCKVGVDPLYMDDSATVKYSGWNFATLATSDTGVDSTPIFNDGTYEEDMGYWAIRFYDSNGEDWLTEPIEAAATCADVIAALEALPNDVIPDGSLSCTRIARTDATDMGYSQNADGDFDGTVNTLAWQAADSTWTNSSTADQSRDQYIFYRLAFWEAQSALGVGEDSAMFQLYGGGDSAMDDDLVKDPLYNSANVAADADTGSTSTGNTAAAQVFIRGYIYRVHFFENPGALKQPEIEIYLDGKRPSLVVKRETSDTYKVITKVWTDGQQGEHKDYFADHCDNVAVRIMHTTGTTLSSTTSVPGGTGVSYFDPDSISTAENLLIKECLGGSDFDDTNNIELYDWDVGSQDYPHLIKLVRATSTYTDGGYYAVLYAQTAAPGSVETPRYRLMTPFQSPDNLETDEWEIYTTKGVLALTSEYASATVDFGSKYFYSSYIPYDKDPTHSTTVETFDWDGDLSCENHPTEAVDTYAYMRYCLNKTDIFTIVNWDMPYFNPPQINLYTAERLYAKSFSYSRLQVSSNAGDEKGKYVTGSITGSDTTFEEGELHYMTHVITADIGSNWGVGSPGATSTTGSSNGQFWVYKFFPDDDSTYEYVAECSNRGLCNTDSGLCECFAGYTNDNCDTQSSIAL